MKLIPNAREAWKFHSTHILAVLAVFPPVWSHLPADLKASVPPDLLPYIASAVALAGIIGRVRDQQ